MLQAIAGSLCVLLVACSGGSGDDEVESIEKRCLRMRAHLIDIRLGAPGSASDTALARSIHAQHRDALTAALGEDFADRCIRSMSNEQIACVLSATDSEAVTACNTAR